MPDKTSFAQWVRDHAITGDVLDPHAPLDDLEPLRALIGDARVVAISESAHDVQEFELLRHRLLRFFAERCGFAVYALDAYFTEAHAIDAWVQGGPDSVAKVAAPGVAIDIGHCSEMHDLLT
jgi:erythromycin esterase